MSEYRLHCLGESGNCYKVALMLQVCGLPWTPVFVDYFGGETRGDAYRESRNELGEVPMLEAEGMQLTQSGVILTWLAQKTGRFGGSNEAERLEALRWILFDNHKFTSYFATWRFLKSFMPTAPDPAVEKFLRGRIDNAFGIAEKHLATRNYLVGTKPTIADMSLAGYVFFPPEESGYDFVKQYPAIARWRERLRQLPGWKSPYELLPGEKVAPRW